jgi:hypothetical protein
MCLHTVTNRQPEDSGVGYKIFVLEEDGSLTPLYRIDENYRYHLNEWTTDPNQFPLNRWGSVWNEHQYETGFHMFLNLEDAEALRKDFGHVPKAVVAKVRYRKAVVEGGFHVIGEKSECNCIVAKEMFIEEILG